MRHVGADRGEALGQRVGDGRGRRHVVDEQGGSRQMMILIPYLIIAFAFGALWWMYGPL